MINFELGRHGEFGRRRRGSNKVPGTQARVAVLRLVSVTQKGTVEFPLLNRIDKRMARQYKAALESLFMASPNIKRNKNPD